MTGSPHRHHWLLDPTVRFLNHGSFGATPRVVLDAQTAFRERLEREPVQFLTALLPNLLAETRSKVANFLDASADDLVFTSNATDGVNAVLRSLSFGPGDDILVTNHNYGACRNAVEYVAERSGAQLTVAQVPFPLRDPEQVVDAILRALTPNTKLALIDHVTSVTGLVWPIARLVSLLRERGVETLVDGAHAPGMVEVSLNELGAGYYAANFHKWGCAPKGAAVLWVRRDLQGQILPTVVSHGFRAPQPLRFRHSFDWTGTRDPTPWLCIPIALDFLSTLCPGGFPEMRSTLRALALAARSELCAALNLAPPAPDSMIGSLLSVPLTRCAQREPGLPQDALYYRLLKRGFEALVLPWPDESQLVVRVSAQLYNHAAEFRDFASALAEEASR